MLIMTVLTHCCLTGLMLPLCVSKQTFCLFPSFQCLIPKPILQKIIHNNPNYHRKRSKERKHALPAPFVEQHFTLMLFYSINFYLNITSSRYFWWYRVNAVSVSATTFFCTMWLQWEGWITASQTCLLQHTSLQLIIFLWCYEFCL